MGAPRRGVCLGHGVAMGGKLRYFETPDFDCSNLDFLTKNPKILPFFHKIDFMP